MEIKNYIEPYFEEVFEIVHKTIEEIYPKYYPRNAVDFYHNILHSRESMEKQIPNETILVLIENNEIIGTGAVFENEIKRFFVLPEYQGKGFGRILLLELEKIIKNSKYAKIVLYSTLGSYEFYRKNGYLQKKFLVMELSDGGFLCGFEMEKNI